MSTTGANLHFVSLVLFSFQMSLSSGFVAHWMQNFFPGNWFQGFWGSNVAFGNRGGRQLCPTGSPSCYLYDKFSDIGPRCWSVIDDPNNRCCDEGGFFQSPIDIRTTDGFVQTLGALRYDNGDVLNGKLENNGIYPQFVLTNKELFPRPTLRGIPTSHGLGYVFDNIHIHFGGRNEARQTEHTLNGKTFQAEAHLVHYREDFNNVQEASTHPDGLAVIGIFLSLTEGELNAGFNTILSQLPLIQKFGKKENVCMLENTRIGLNKLFRRPSSGKCRFWTSGYLPLALNSQPVTDTKVNDIQVNPNILLPSNGLYFNYDGGLTNPPCSESVLWFVAEKPVRVAPLVISLFSQLEARIKGQKISDFGNLRPLQKLGGRQIRKLKFTV